ncbi:hypothetical protein ACTXT7_009153 [Hymenolepis weldensis]
MESRRENMTEKVKSSNSPKPLIVFSTNPKPFKCDLCEKSYIPCNLLKIHIRNIHENLRQFAYIECNKIYDSKFSLNFCVDSGHRSKTLTVLCPTNAPPLDLETMLVS